MTSEHYKSHHELITLPISVYIHFNSMEWFGGSKIIKGNNNNNNKSMFTQYREKEKTFTCSWQNLLSSVGFDRFVATSSSFASTSGWVPPATLTFSSFSGVIIPGSQKRIGHLNFKRLTMSISEKLCFPNISGSKSTELPKNQKSTFIWC